VTSPVVLHISRPYANVEEYLAAEAWCVDAHAMLLIDQPPLERDTAIVFDVTLADGSRPIKAEARVSRVIAPTGDRPGGLRVRFKRYSAPTKAFIDRAMQFTAQGLASPTVASDPNAAAEPELASSVEHIPALAAPLAPAPAAAATQPFSAVPVAQSGADVPAGLAALRGRNAAAPEMPAQREYLLEKLRQRGQNDDVTSRFVRPG
jgi:hypothetical protein